MASEKYVGLKKLVKAIAGPYLYEVIRHVIAHKRIPRLLNPVTFNDKTAHRKLYDHNPIYPIISDKALARDYVAERLGNDILTQLYFCGDNVEDIDFDALPDSFVIKTTHGSGPDYIEFVHDKQQFGEDALRKMAQELIHRDYGDTTNEWWYAQMIPQIIIEEMLHDDEYGIPLDYKFFVFHDEVKFLQVDFSRYGSHARTIYDREWIPQDFMLKRKKGPVTPKPQCFSEMIRIAECLGKGFDFIRIDLYCVNDKRVVFGEMTLSHGAGWEWFRPAKWDRIFGDLW